MAGKFRVIIPGMIVPAGPIASAIYNRVRTDVRAENVLIKLPYNGVIGFRSAQLDVERQINEKVGDNPYDIIGQSYGAVVAMIQAARDGRVQRVAALSPPAPGTTICPQLMGILDRLYLSRALSALQIKSVHKALNDLSPQSGFMQSFQAEMADFFARVDPKKPEIHSLYVAKDRIVVPSHSSYVPGARNYFLVPAHRHAALRERIPADVELVACGPTDHLRAILMPEVRGLLQEIMSGSHLRIAA